MFQKKLAHSSNLKTEATDTRRPNRRCYELYSLKRVQQVLRNYYKQVKQKTNVACYLLCTWLRLSVCLQNSWAQLELASVQLVERWQLEWHWEQVWVEGVGATGALHFVL